MNLRTIRRALLSVSDKSRLIDLARGLGVPVDQLLADNGDDQTDANETPPPDPPKRGGLTASGGAAGTNNPRLA